AAESKDWFGSAVRLADADGDGRADLVATAYGENDAAGALWVLRGTASGLTTKGARTVSARQVGLRGQSNFGGTLA
ncbi:FG-GAP repeat protein, partial [Streptomyces neyagawaensis]